jgi:type IV pilus assembly protein PilV
MLLEGLIALLIFSMGILAIVGMQASAVKASSDAKYRSEASLLANELIGRMWVSDRTQATLQTAFASTTGTGYQAWAWVGTHTTPGTQTAPAAGTVLATLPGAQANLPTVVIAPVASTSIPSSLVTITISWQAPNETSSHQFVAVAQIGG